MRPRYSDLFESLMDPDSRRSDQAFDAILFDREQAIPDLVQLYASADETRLRFYAIQLLGFTESQKALGTIMEGLEDSEPLVRAEACRACEDLRAREAIPLLHKRTRDVDREVRRAAREALLVLEKGRH